MLTLRDLVESALEGRDPRLLARCDVHKILAIFDGLCIFDVDTLAGNLATSFAELQTALQPAAAPAFLGLLAATMAKKVAAQEPLLGAPPSTPSTGGPPFSSPPSSSSAPPVVVTVKMNGKVVAERTTLMVPPATTWEAVARMRLKAVLSADELASYASMPLSVGLFRSADMLPSDRLNEPISDCVASAHALGYAHVLLELSTPVYGCARPPARGVDATARMMADAHQEAAGGAELPKPYAPNVEGGKLAFERALFNAVRQQCDRQGLRVAVSDVTKCTTLLLAVRNAVWLHACPWHLLHACA